MHYRGSVGSTLSIRLKPRSHETRIISWQCSTLTVAVREAPVEGRANAALLRFLAEIFDIPLSSLVLEVGASGRHKRVRTPLSSEELLQRLSSYGTGS